MSSANGHGSFDLDAAAAAAAAEGDAEPFPFTFKGHDYTVPPMRVWPLSALRAVSRGDLDDALGLLLGGETYDAICADGLTVGQLNVLFERIAGTSGLTLPNSPPPARPGSHRTSRR